MNSKQMLTYQGMKFTQENYAANPEMTDTQFAAYMTKELKILFSCALVRSYRKALGIPNNVVVPDSRMKKAIDLLIEAYQSLPISCSELRRDIRALLGDDFNLEDKT
jgi:hypothetical protein